MCLLCDPEDAGGNEDREGEVAPEPRAAEEPAQEDQEDEGEQKKADREGPPGRDRPAAVAFEGAADPGQEGPSPCERLGEHELTLQPGLTYSYMGI